MTLSNATTISAKAPEEEFSGELRPYTEEEERAVGKALLSGNLNVAINTIREHLIVGDRLGLEVILGMAAAHYVPGEMLWVRIYGASRSGKTEILRAIASHPDATEVESFTPASVRGGLTGGHKLLERINGKLVVTKDLAPALTAKREVRNELFGLLRNVKDGSLTSDFGTKEGYVSQASKFDWLIGTTPVFAQYRQMEDLLGARFVDLMWSPGDREAIAFKAAENNPILRELRGQWASTVGGLMDAAKRRMEIHQAQLERGVETSLAKPPIPFISKLADLTALLRSPISRDRYHCLKSMPYPEIGSDLAQSLSRIAQGLALLGVESYEGHLTRLACDCIPDIRVKVLQGLAVETKTEVDLAVRTKIPQSTVKLTLEDLQLLQVVHQEGNSTWRIESSYEERMVALVLP